MGEDRSDDSQDRLRGESEFHIVVGNCVPPAFLTRGQERAACDQHFNILVEADRPPNFNELTGIIANSGPEVTFGYSRSRISRRASFSRL